MISLTKNSPLLSVLSVLAAAVIVLLIFAGCSVQEESGDNDTKATTNMTTESGTSDTSIAESRKGFSVSNERESVPDSDFNGRDFTILIIDPVEYIWTYTNMVVEEGSAETIDDAYYRRNRNVEDRLNINIKQTPTSLSVFSKNFKNAVDSGTNSFDIALLRYGDAASLATSNYLAELNDLPYLDFNKPWWDKSSLSDLSISHRNYMMSSDISIGDNDNTWLIYFDKQMVLDYALDSPYSLVNEGKWTFDKMLEMMKATKKDVNNDGKMDKDDQFGFLTHTENYAGMWIAANQTLIAKDSDDMPYIAFGNERFYSVWQKIITLMNDPSCKQDDIPFISEGLGNGQTLFANEILSFVRNYRVNERDFGIIPMPKYDEQQEEYHTYVAESAPLLIVPQNNSDLEMTSIIVEVMAAEGHRTIMPAYYETAINGKFVRDVESIEMLDIAFSTRKYDLGVVFNFGNMKTVIKDNYGPKNNPNIASYLEKNGARIQTAIEKTFSTFEAY
ncbi:hypothetical protein FACS1894105_11330 [Clostridia bacterium]|nr:hypothetical protein FACS1894105_11330 [Clostridia bacterium]